MGPWYVHVAKRLEREDYCREICTFYPYGLNDNVRKVGNISKCKDKSCEYVVS